MVELRTGLVLGVDLYKFRVIYQYSRGGLADIFLYRVYAVDKAKFTYGLVWAAVQGPQD